MDLYYLELYNMPQVNRFSLATIKQETFMSNLHLLFLYVPYLIVFVLKYP